MRPLGIHETDTNSQDWGLYQRAEYFVRSRKRGLVGELFTLLLLSEKREYLLSLNISPPASDRSEYCPLIGWSHLVFIQPGDPHLGM